MRLNAIVKSLRAIWIIVLLSLLFHTSSAAASVNLTRQSEASTLEQAQLSPIIPLFTRTPSRTPTRTPTPINVGNFVWDDIDGDGRQDAGEPGLAGVTVQLWNSTKTALLDSAVTDANGRYTLIAPTPGNYRVRVLLPSAADQFSPKDQAAGDDQLDSDINPSGTDFGFTDTYVFGSNLISITTIDAGIRIFRTPTATRTPTPINIGNLIWNDLDGDGVQDPGEPGLAGITVQLWNEAKNNLIDQDLTNASGVYTLVAPIPGTYRVRVLLPNAEADFTFKDQGSDLSDSDINPSGTNIGFTDSINLASNVISITSIDAGMVGTIITPTPTNTATNTPTTIFTNTATGTPTNTPTATRTLTAVTTPSMGASLTPSRTSTNLVVTATGTPGTPVVITSTPTTTPTASQTVSRTPTRDPASTVRAFMPIILR